VVLVPDSPDFRYNWATPPQVGNIDDAIACYRDAVRLKSDHGGAWRDWPGATAGRPAGRSCGAFDGWLRTDPGNPWLLPAGRLQRRGAPDRAGRLHPQSSTIWRMDSTRIWRSSNIERRSPGAAVSAAAGNAAASLNILDAGCGTGLCGPLLRPFARDDRVDLSPACWSRPKGA